MNPCPEKNALQGVLDGGLSEAETTAYAAHLQNCARCRQLLDELSEDAELRRWADFARPLEFFRETESGLARVVAALRTRHEYSATARQTPADQAVLEPPRHPGDLGSIGPYRVLAELGRGGMGIVLRGFDELLHRPVAIKVLRPELLSDRMSARFLQEAQAAARLQHDHIVRIYAVANTPRGLPYLVMEYLEGQTLAEHLEDRQSPTPEAVAELLAQVADGFSAAHAVGLIHRDIKPRNLHVDAVGRVRILDFGLVRLLDQPTGFTQEGTLLGTPVYMSPEQIQGLADIDCRSDVYSLGVTLYETLTGEAPFRGKPHLIFQQVLRDDPVPPRRLNDAIPRDLEKICLKAMAREPARRYASAQALADDLRRFLRGEPVRAHLPGRLERGWRWCKRNPRVALLSGVLLGLLLLLAGGSTLAAVVIAQARGEADRKRQDAEFAQEQAEQAADDAKKAQAAAAANAQAAGAHFGLALDTIDTLINRVQGQLEQGGTLKLRAQLMQTALAGLEKIARSAEKSPASDLQLVEAHEKLGHLFFRLDQRTQARAQFERGRNVARALLHADPGNIPARLRLASLLENLGNIALYAGEGKGAATLYEAALEEQKAIARALAENADAQFKMAQLYTSLADVQEQNGDPKAAQALNLKAIALLKDRTWPASLQQRLRRALGAAFHRLGSLAIDRKDFRVALQYLEKSLPYREEYLAQEPTAAAHDYYAGSWFLCGEAHAGLGDRKAAEAAYRKATAILEPVSQANRDDSMLAADLAEISFRLGCMLQLGGQRSAARKAYSKTLLLFESLPPATPAKRQMDLMRRAYVALARIEEGEEHHAEAAAWMDRALRNLPTTEPDATARKRRQGQYESRRALYLAAAASGLEDPEKWSVKVGPVWTGLLRLRALSLARQGKHAAAAAAAEQLIRASPADAEAIFDAARVFARCAANLAATSPSEAEKALRQSYVSQAVQAVREALKCDPRLEQDIHLHSDLEPLHALVTASRKP